MFEHSAERMTKELFARVDGDALNRLLVAWLFVANEVVYDRFERWPRRNWRMPRQRGR